MKKPRAASRRGRQKRNRADPDLRIPATAVLTTIRRIKQSINNEFDPQERRRLRRLLNHTFRKVRAYRRALEGLRRTPFGGPAIEEQIQIFLMVEDEFRASDQRPV